MVVKDGLPLLIVENEGFRGFVKKLKPHYTLPRRKKLTKLSEDRHGVIKDEFKLKVDKALSYSVTCDNWTDITNQSYLGITIHCLSTDLKLSSGVIGLLPLHTSHTAENVSDSLNIMINDNGLDKNKIISVVSDSAANIKLAIEMAMTADKHVPCVAHIVSHLVPDTLKQMSTPLGADIKDKVKNIVSVVRKSTIGCDRLKNLQKKDRKTDAQCLKLHQSIDIRWNSSLYMLKRYLEIEEYVYWTIRHMKKQAEKNKKARVHNIVELKSEEVEVLRDLIPIMETVEFGIKQVPVQEYSTCSLAIPIAHCMEMNIRSSPTPATTIYGREFEKNLLILIAEMRIKLEKNTVLSMSTILNPQFKNIHFSNPLNASDAVRKIESVIKRRNPVPEKFSLVTFTLLDNTSKNQSFWNAHDKYVETSSFGKDPENYSTKLQHYLKQPLQNRPRDPLELWKTLKMSFPGLYDVAIRYIGLLCSSVSSERLFSAAGIRKDKKRNQLTGEHLDQILFLDSIPLED